MHEKVEKRTQLACYLCWSDSYRDLFFLFNCWAILLWKKDALFRWFFTTTWTDMCRENCYEVRKKNGSISQLLLGFWCTHICAIVVLVPGVAKKMKDTQVFDVTQLQGATPVVTHAPTNLSGSAKTYFISCNVAHEYSRWGEKTASTNMINTVFGLQATLSGTVKAYLLHLCVFLWDHVICCIYCTRRTKAWDLIIIFKWPLLWL